MSKAMDQGPSFRIQRLADFEEQYAPHTALAAPGTPHYSYTGGVLSDHLTLILHLLSAENGDGDT